ncbi:MAG: MBL fold metallo-hydrolase [Bacteroidales bacterium]
MKLHTIETGNFKLDGGAMFGVVPKVLWNKAYPADENNLCTWSMRSMLVQDRGRNILIDNGIGDTLDEKFLKHFYLHGDDSLEGSLQKLGLTRDDITDVVLTHLHFDHCGGNVIREGGAYVPAFANATYRVSRDQYNWAINPNAREKASYFRHMIQPVEAHGQLKLIDEEVELFPGFRVKFFDGHTRGQVLPFITHNGRTFVYMADLLPAVAHIPLPWVMAYDMHPLVTLEEKEKFLGEALEKDYILFFEHDLYNECCTLQQTEKGIRVKDTFRLEDVV